MNGKDMFLSLQYVGLDLIEEGESAMFSKSAADATPARKKKYRQVLTAALIAIMLLLVGCAVAYSSGLFAELFAKRSDEPLSNGQVDFIQDNEQVILATQSANEWTVELKSTMHDDKSGYILFHITAPDNVDLEGHFADQQKDGNAPYITPGNYSRRGSMRAIVIASTGYSDVNKNFYWGEHGYWEADNDGRSNTLNYVVEIRCEKLYPNKEMLLQNPFGKDITFQARLFDFTLEYEDPEVRASVEAKLAGMGDGMVDGEELSGLYKTDVLVEGEWIFDVTFTDATSDTLELVTEPVAVDAWVHRKIENGTMFYDTSHAIEQIEISSFVLSPMGANVTYHQEENVIGVFLEWDGTNGVYVVLQDGTRIQLQSNGTGYTWYSDVPIVLGEVDYVQLANGEILKAP